jgi:tRNA(fMet)-specific endonuclease VapC
MRHLDTDTAIGCIKGHRIASIRIARYFPRVFISSVVYSELIFGAHKSTSVTDNLRRIEEFIESVPVVEFDVNAADAAGHLRASLEKAGRPLATMDIMIAGAALANNAILVIHYTRHFKRVPGLQLEDWLA